MSELEENLPLTVSVPVYAKATFDLEEMAAYAAAGRGDFPTVQVGRLKRVPVRSALRKLAGDDPEILKEITKDFASELFRMKEKAA